MRLGDLLHGLGFDMVAIARRTTMSPCQIEELCDLTPDSVVGVMCHWLAHVACYCQRVNPHVLEGQAIASMYALAWPKQMQQRLHLELAWDELAWEAMAVYLYG